MAILLLLLEKCFRVCQSLLAPETCSWLPLVCPEATASLGINAKELAAAIAGQFYHQRSEAARGKRLDILGA
jgi:hypothetical protein